MKKDFPTKHNLSNYTDSPMVFKLVTGEEIIVTDFSIDDTQIILNNPYIIIKFVSQQGTNVQVDQWLPYTDVESVQINMKDILLYTIPSDTFISYYLSIINQDEEYKNETIKHAFISTEIH